MSSVLHAQDLRNDMFGVRRAGHEPRVSKRSEVTQVEDRLRPFYHGVASGDPLTDRLIIWTRVTPQNGEESIDVQWRVATDTALTTIVRQGAGVARADRDYTVKVDVDGLAPGTVYYYGFIAYGRASLTGRTRTLRTGTIDHAKVAVVSCSNYPAGYFTSYGFIAERNDLDAALHLGDYIYEYDADTTSFGGQTGARLGRRHTPDAELIKLSDYRTRYSQYRLDADLRRLHQQHPMIHVWDDHESANDSYTDGAQNHQDNEGDWSSRKAVSRQACYEWMPTRESSDGKLYRRFVIGDLVDISMLDTRLEGRDKQIEEVGPSASKDAKDSLNKPNRKIMSSTQFDWLTGNLTSSTARWKLLGNQVIYAPVNVTPIDTNYLFSSIGPLFTAILRPQLPTLQTVFEQAFYGDVWSNYPAQRRQLSTLLRSSSIENVVIVTGDFHSTFAMDVPIENGEKIKPVAVEFITPSVTSSNFDENFSAVAGLSAIQPQLLKTVDTTLTQRNGHLKWNNITDHGYMVVSFFPDSVQSDWYFIRSLTERPTAQRWERGYRSLSGMNQLQRTSSSAPAKSVQDVPAPNEPPVVTSVQNEGQSSTSAITILSCGPNPARDAYALSYVVSQPSTITVTLRDVRGTIVWSSDAAVEHGLNSMVISTAELAAGRYRLEVTDGMNRVGVDLIRQK
ncbi:MAG: alkaline phosphatase D family protein, partial [Candidatus Kapaibacterium sp.]